MVATHKAGHNSDGFKVITPNKTGSDPNGNKVAANSDAQNKTIKPYSGCARFVNRD